MSGRLKLEIVRGENGTTGVYLDDCRIAGVKPVGGGVTTHKWDVDPKEIRIALARADGAGNETGGAS